MMSSDYDYFNEVFHDPVELVLRTFRDSLLRIEQKDFITTAGTVSMDFLRTVGLPQNVDRLVKFLGFQFNAAVSPLRTVEEVLKDQEIIASPEVRRNPCLDFHLLSDRYYPLLDYTFDFIDLEDSGSVKIFESRYNKTLFVNSSVKQLVVSLALYDHFRRHYPYGGDDLHTTEFIDSLNMNFYETIYTLDKRAVPEPYVEWRTNDKETFWTRVYEDINDFWW